MLSIGASGILELAIGYAILHVSIADLMAVKNVMNIFNWIIWSARVVWLAMELFLMLMKRWILVSNALRIA